MYWPAAQPTHAVDPDKLEKPEAQAVHDEVLPMPYVLTGHTEQLRLAVVLQGDRM